MTHFQTNNLSFNKIFVCTNIFMYILPRIDGFVNPHTDFFLSVQIKVVKKRCILTKILDIKNKIHYNYYI